ncbi:MAG TPA: hypothetical protein VMY59_10105 [Candidatus Thermoplasmatota archaeon]|nr:hypothetical protein [Candidatus Thermoplasmatota archaeon]
MVRDGNTMGEKKIISIVVVLLFLGLIPITIAAQHHSCDPVIKTGYGKGKIFGIHPIISRDDLTLCMILPFFGMITIAKSRFSGHLGIILIVGDYEWFENGPPAISTSLR